jgi:hypothetical protein
VSKSMLQHAHARVRTIAAKSSAGRSVSPVTLIVSTASPEHGNIMKKGRRTRHQRFKTHLI